MLRIAWIVPGFSSNESDWCIPALLDLARAMAPRCDLTIVAMRYPYRRATYAVGGARVISIGGAHRGPLYTPGIWRDTALAVKNVHCDVLHAFWAYEPGMIAAWFRSGLPVIISLAGGELVHLPGIQYGLMGKLRTRLPILWALRNARVVTAGSSFLLEIAGNLLPNQNLRHLPLGVDLQRWKFSQHTLQTGIVLNVGSLEPVKGQAVLLRAFQRVVRHVPSARLRIVGGGQNLSRLKTLSEELGCLGQVEFVGPVPHHELAGFYSGASVFAQASWHEAQGMAVLEAGTCGLPIVGTEVGVLPHLAPDAAIRTLVGDDSQLSDAILKILADPDEATRLGNRAREKVEETYAIWKTADRLMELYESLV